MPEKTTAERFQESIAAQALISKRRARFRIAAIIFLALAVCLLAVGFWNVLRR